MRTARPGTRFSPTEEEEPLSPNSSSASFSLEDGLDVLKHDNLQTAASKSVLLTDDKLQVLSDAAPFGIPVPYPRKAEPRVLRQDSAYSFVRNLFVVQGSVLGALVPHLLLALAMTALARVLQALGGLPSLPVSLAIAHAVLGMLVVTILGARLYKALRHLREAKALASLLHADLRDVLMTMAQLQHADGEEGGMQAFTLLFEALRRKVNVLFAAIRQSVRESREGFCPASDMAAMGFDAHTFALDMTRPRLCDLITEEEYDRYGKMRVSVRPTVVCMELHRLSHALLSLSADDHLRGCVDAKLHQVMRHWAAIAHIADRPRPFALLHLVNLLIFIEVYLAPFIYPSTPRGGFTLLPIADAGLLATLLLCVAFYGLDRVCHRLGRPFGWEDEAVDLERYGMDLNLDGVEIAKLAGIKDPRLFMTEDMFWENTRKTTARDYVTYLHNKV